MPLPKIEEIRELDDQELTDQIVATKKELFQLRFQKATRQMEKPHQFKHLRHRLAQLMTIERERQLAAVLETNTEASGAEEE
jgi:large subunit ribosomal protein L29